MRKAALSFLFIGFCGIASPQIIRGTVCDETERSPIGLAAVYFNGTFTGTRSDTTGYFEIDVSKNVSSPLIISALGYYSTSVSNLSPGIYYRIYLKQKVFELDDVVISAEGGRDARRQRREDIKMFREVFIGETPNAKKCRILNEDDLLFRHSSRGDTVEAFSLKPLSVENNSLGYKISYYLDQFEYSERKAYFYFYGNIMFLEDSTARYKDSRKFEQNREAAFSGSRMQFFRALWEDNLDTTGFKVMDNKQNKLSSNDFVIQPDSLSKCLMNIGNLTVTCTGRKPPSYIYFNRDSVYFYKNGNFDGSGIRWDGEMANPRIADQLPYEYCFMKKNP